MGILEDKLQVLSEDKIAIDAITSVFTNRIEESKPAITPYDNNEILGQKYRAFEEAKRILNQSLKDIENYKKTPKPEDGFDKSK